jgi:sigma-B regulation protein RsbU (phosphoserine phosphatase)
MAEDTGQASAVLQLEEENRRLRRALEELSIINDLARAISASLDSQSITRTVVRRSLRAIGAEQGVITLVAEKPADPTKTLVRTWDESGAQEHFHLHQTLLGWMHLNRKPLMVSDPANDPRFQGIRWDPSIRSLLCVPMMIRSGLKGVITLYNKKSGATFTEEDQRLLAIIAAQSAQVIENARLNEKEKQLLHMQQEMDMASRIQRNLLPERIPGCEGYDIAGKSIPAQTVGGDYFDFIRVTGDRLAFCLGDVSGKGVPASLLMANVQATLRGQAFLTSSAAECIMRSNSLLYRSTGDDKFVTLFYGILNHADHVLQFSNAGQDHPFLISGEHEVARLSAGGLALSVLDDFPYQEETVTLSPGDLVVVYSDGIPEAVDAAQQQYGEHRLRELLLAHREEPASAVVDQIIAAVQKHAEGVPQMDDMTVVVVKRQR